MYTILKLWVRLRGGNKSAQMMCIYFQPNQCSLKLLTPEATDDDYRLH